MRVKSEKKPTKITFIIIKYIIKNKRFLIKYNVKYHIFYNIQRAIKQVIAIDP